MALAMFKLLAYFLMFSISNGPIATNRLKFLEFFSIFKSPLALKGRRLHIPTFVKLKELHPPKKVISEKEVIFGGQNSKNLSVIVAIGPLLMENIKK